MAGFLGLLPFLYLNAALASTDNAELSNPSAGNRDYLSRYPSDWMEIGRRGSSVDKLRKMALSVGKRFGPADSADVSALLKRPGSSQDAPKRKETVPSGTAVDASKNKANSHQLFTSNGLQSLKDLLSPILTTDELVTQIQENPRLAKAVVDAWIDTNNDGVITGSEILGRK